MIDLKYIVVGIDLTGEDRLVADIESLEPACRMALETAALFAESFGDVLHVVSALDVDPLAERLIRNERTFGHESLLDVAARTLDGLVAPLRTRGVTITSAVEFGRPADVLLADARRQRPDLVVVGTRKSGADGKGVVGNTAVQLLRHHPSPVWIARQQVGPPPRRVLAAIALGELTPRVLEVATSVAAGLAAELHLVHAVERGSERLLRAFGVANESVAVLRLERDGHIADRMAQLVGEIAPSLAVVPHVREGVASSAVAAIADELAADVVVAGTTEHGGFHSLIVGSTVERLLEKSTRSVLVVKPPAAAS